ncbi:hypothetical protein C0J52_23084 [Blattella germanica]|nr:hypothetical protein C0J52_23084 [Blattella germanica]
MQREKGRISVPNSFVNNINSIKTQNSLLEKVDANILSPCDNSNTSTESTNPSHADKMKIHSNFSDIEENDSANGKNKMKIQF